MKFAFIRIAIGFTAVVAVISIWQAIHPNQTWPARKTMAGHKEVPSWYHAPTLPDGAKTGKDQGEIKKRAGVP
jgi:hypothetical protein